MICDNCNSLMGIEIADNRKNEGTIVLITIYTCPTCGRIVRAVTAYEVVKEGEVC